MGFLSHFPRRLSHGLRSDVLSHVLSQRYHELGLYRIGIVSHAARAPPAMHYPTALSHQQSIRPRQLRSIA
jgi:hypothetical protein